MMGTEKRRVFAAHPAERKHTILLDFLEQEQISKELRDGIEEYRKTYPTPPELLNRVPRPRYHYYGKEVWEAAVAAILCGENLLLAGSKATGKNVLAENLAQVFARPGWDVSFHVNMDAAGLIGMDTFENGQVTFRPGPIYLCARYGGFGVLDEINMAKNEALAVLHAALDFRRSIDVPGYDRVEVHPAARFIGTMNYGYAGTRELNEALVSRFTVIRMPTLDEAQLCELLRADVPEAAEENIRRCVGLFLDLNAKAVNGEISTNSVDLRGMITALRLVTDGMAPNEAIAVSITNKCFDEYEYELVRDVALTRFA